jgi:GNAT superfamily N-acetyltransferase
MSDLKIRPAVFADLPRLVAFNCSMALETEEKQLDLETVTRGVKAMLEDPRLGRYFVAVVDGDVVGQLMLTEEWSDWRDGRFWWIQSVYVEPTARRRGIYRALHAYVVERAKTDPTVCGLRLYVATHNRNARFTYESLGMKAADYALYEVELPRARA